jgi:hypothetical protein
MRCLAPTAALRCTAATGEFREMRPALGAQMRWLTRRPRAG